MFQVGIGNSSRACQANLERSEFFHFKTFKVMPIVWDLKNELIELAVKCTSLAPSTAKKHASKVFDKHYNNDGCISWRSMNEYDKVSKQNEELRRAIKIVKSRQISSSKRMVSLDEISTVLIDQTHIKVTIKNGEEIRYLKEHWGELVYVFNMEGGL